MSKEEKEEKSRGGIEKREWLNRKEKGKLWNKKKGFRGEEGREETKKKIPLTFSNRDPKMLISSALKFLQQVFLNCISRLS